MEALQKENRDLRTELDDLSKRVSKVSVLEEEMSKIHSAYQGCRHVEYSLHLFFHKENFLFEKWLENWFELPF